MISSSFSFGAINIGNSAIDFFICLNAVFAFAVHWKSLFFVHFFRVLKNCTNFSADLDRNLLRFANLPFSFCTSFKHFGDGKLRTASTLSGHTFNPSAFTLYPRNVPSLIPKIALFLSVISAGFKENILRLSLSRPHSSFCPSFVRVEPIAIVCFSAICPSGHTISPLNPISGVVAGTIWLLTYGRNLLKQCSYRISKEELPFPALSIFSVCLFRCMHSSVRVPHGGRGLAKGSLFASAHDEYFRKRGCIRGFTDSANLLVKKYDGMERKPLVLPRGRTPRLDSDVRINTHVFKEGFPSISLVIVGGQSMTLVGQRPLSSCLRAQIPFRGRQLSHEWRAKVACGLFASALIYLGRASVVLGLFRTRRVYHSFDWAGAQINRFVGFFSNDFLLEQGIDSKGFLEFFDDTTRFTYLVNRSPSSAIRFKKPIDMLGFFGWLASIDLSTGWLNRLRNMGFNENRECNKTFIGSDVGTGLVQVLKRDEFEMEPHEDHTFEVEPHGNVNHVAGSQEVQTHNLIYYHSAYDREQHSAWGLFSYREDDNEAAFAVVVVDKIYAHKSPTFNNVFAYGTVFSYGCKAEIWVTKGLLVKSKGNILGLEIIKDQSGNNLRVSQSRIYNEKLVQTLLKGHSTLSLEDSLSWDCDVEKNGLIVDYRQTYRWKLTTSNTKRSTQQCMEIGVAKHLGVAGIQQQNGLVDEINMTLFAKVWQGVEFEVKPQEDHTFEVEPHGIVDHVVGSHEVQTYDLIYYHSARDREQHSALELFSYREDNNEAL
nr:zinc finger, CCHC-type [Tanacetum cinerariifolium]